MRETVNQTAAPAANLSHVTKLYRRRHLGKLTVTRGIEDVSFEIRSGEIFGLLGLNGAGKTTAIKLLLGLLFPTLGEARLYGVRLPDQAVMHRVGYLPELPTLYKYLNIRELLSLYGKLSDMTHAQLAERIPRVIEEIGLAPHQHKQIKEYSKGMQQRAGLAQALLHDPDLFILDEPVSGLDPLGLKEMRQLLIRLNEQGKTIFFSSHIISEAEKICHRVGVLHQGRLVRILERQEWESREGRLEEMFLETLHA
jgi:ABC-2 type transport system ATP-binding protein